MPFPVPPARRAAPLALALLLAAGRPARAAVLGPGATFTSILATRSGTGRMAWQMDKDDDGRLALRGFAFLLMRVSFSQTDSPDRWPSICDQFWTWDELAHRFRQVSTASANLSGTAQCAFTGTVYFKGYLIPRIDIRPGVSVYVEGAQGVVDVPVRVVLDDRTPYGGGSPAFLGAISTTALADGIQRLRVLAWYRDVEIDGNPATPEFEPGGDANVIFAVNNEPARLRELTVAAAGVTLYDGAWVREGPPGAERLTLRRTTAAVSLGGPGARARLVLRFSEPVGRVTVTLRRRDGLEVPLAPPEADGGGEAGDTWRTRLDADTVPPGAWAARVAATDLGGHPLERLGDGPVDVAALGRIRPDTGECEADGRPCSLGDDVSHRFTVRR